MSNKQLKETRSHFRRPIRNSKGPAWNHVTKMPTHAHYTAWARPQSTGQVSALIQSLAMKCVHVITYIESSGYNGFLYTFQSLFRKDQGHCYNGYLCKGPRKRRPDLESQFCYWGLHCSRLCQAPYLCHLQATSFQNLSQLVFPSLPQNSRPLTIPPITSSFLHHS